MGKAVNRAFAFSFFSAKPPLYNLLLSRHGNVFLSETGKKDAVPLLVLLSP